MSGEELLDPLGFMRQEIVGDEMDLLAARLVGDQSAQKSHEFLTGVAGGGFRAYRRAGDCLPGTSRLA